MFMSYRSIFLAPDWAHQKYFGWKELSCEPGLRILTRGRFPITRYLFLLERAGRDVLDRQVSRYLGKAALADIIVHDFDDVLASGYGVGSSPFRRAEQRERLLNVATFVIDLRRTDDELMSQMSADYRRKIRRAASTDVEIEANANPPQLIVDEFADEFRRFAEDRALNAVDPQVLSSMYRGGNAILLVARKSGKTTNFLHLYKAADAASFMYGVNLSKENDGAGQYLHFEAMRVLRSQGVNWYDMGGVASSDPLDGIYRFKEKFGGEFVSLGCEWRYTGRVASALLMVRNLRQRSR